MMHRLALACAALLALAARAPQDPATTEPRSEETVERQEPRIGIAFEGWLPGSVDPELGGEFEVDFRIYLSPQGGHPVWSERQRLRVERGRIDATLGARERVPMEIHEATFKFLGASVNGGREVYPRYAIVNVAYVSPAEALVAIAEPAAEGAPVEGPGAHDPARARRRVAARTEAACTWREALGAARAAGADLATHLEWYGSLSGAGREEALERAGHYEWVLPWVYDPASHGRFQRYFRGRFEGCDYMDLSPLASYAWRAAHGPQPPPQRAAPEAGADADPARGTEGR